MQENLSTEIPLPTHVNFINRTGLVYGRLTVVRYAGKSDHSVPVCLWECRCECGNTIVTSAVCLGSGNTRSCGCLVKDTLTSRGTHRQSKTRFYKQWLAMVNRCTNPNNSAYKRYGARGITVCQRWRTFENFVSDMGTRPDGKSLDRINNSMGYWCGKCAECSANNQPANCRWATLIEQANNTSANRRISFNGETLTLSQWAVKTKITVGAIHARLKRGWSLEQALTVKMRGRASSSELSNSSHSI